VELLTVAVGCCCTPTVVRTIDACGDSAGNDPEVDAEDGSCVANGSVSCADGGILEGGCVTIDCPSGGTPVAVAAVAAGWLAWLSPPAPPCLPSPELPLPLLDPAPAPAPPLPPPAEAPLPRLPPPLPAPPLPLPAEAPLPPATATAEAVAPSPAVNASRVGDSITLCTEASMLLMFGMVTEGTSGT
jgi:pyruvate dehydrogenase E2 component (dihydrolipoamide acetyltransferase)